MHDDGEIVLLVATAFTREGESGVGEDVLARFDAASIVDELLFDFLEGAVRELIGGDEVAEKRDVILGKSELEGYGHIMLALRGGNHTDFLTEITGETSIRKGTENELLGGIGFSGHITFDEDNEPGLDEFRSTHYLDQMVD